MNIEKLAKHLKEFTFDEIEMIAECDCKTELEQLLNTNKLVFGQGKYKYVEAKNEVKYGIYANICNNYKIINFNFAVSYFLENYVQKYCKKETLHHYKTIFKNHILPYFRNKDLQEVDIEVIKQFYITCKNRNLQAKRIKNILALLNQLIKYFQNLGMIDRRCTFQVRRITAKNEFNLNRITFGGNYDQNEIL